MRPRWRVGADPGVHGELIVCDVQDEILRRRTITARLVDPENLTENLLPPLKDATLLWVKRNALVISGFEQVLDRDYAQTWMLSASADALHALT